MNEIDGIMNRLRMLRKVKYLLLRVVDYMLGEHLLKMVTLMVN